MEIYNRTPGNKEEGIAYNKLIEGLNYEEKKYSSEDIQGDDISGPMAGSPDFEIIGETVGMKFSFEMELDLVAVLLIDYNERIEGWLENFVSEGTEDFMIAREGAADWGVDELRYEIRNGKLMVEGEYWAEQMFENANF